jgi:hypothetical protein
VGIIENFKDVLKLADAANNLDLYKKLAELQNSVLGLQEENQALKERLRETEKQNDIAGHLHVKDNAYYVDDGKQIDGPFCMRCWDVERKLVRERLGATPGTHFCLHCRIR